MHLVQTPPPPPLSPPPPKNPQKPEDSVTVVVALPAAAYSAFLVVPTISFMTYRIQVTPAKNAAVKLQAEPYEK